MSIFPPFHILISYLVASKSIYILNFSSRVDGRFRHRRNRPPPVFRVLRGHGRARTPSALPAAPSAALPASFASPKQRRLRQAFIAMPSPHPRLMAGTDALKTSGDRDNPVSPCPGCSRGRRGFFGVSPQAREAVLGVRDGGCEKPPKALFQGLRRRLAARPKAPLARPTRVRARPRHRSTEKPE